MQELVQAEPRWDAVRAAYPAALRKAYLDTACRGIPPRAAVDAIAAYCELVRESPLASVTRETIVVGDHMTAARRAAAAVIGAGEDEIALVESTTHGLRVAADALDLRAGDEVVVSDLEFEGVVLPWRQLEARGVVTRFVPHRNGRVLAEDLAAAIGPRTRVVCVSSVQEVNGWRVDLAALSRATRELGVTLIVDGTQHVGPVPLDVRETPVDFLAVGGHKWLCAPFGLGFLYVRRELCEELRPTFAGYAALAEPEGGWERYLGDPARTPTADFAYVADARKFELGGTGPYAAAAALAAALDVLLELGLDAIHARVASLTMSLAELLGVAPSGSGIVLFPGAGADALGRLEAAGVAASRRYIDGVGGIRLAPYFYSDESDLERAAEALRR